MILLSQRKPETIYIIVHLYSSAEITAFAISYVFFSYVSFFSIPNHALDLHKE